MNKQELLTGFQPIGNYYVIERDVAPTISPGGLYIPQGSAPPVVSGTVTHVGTGQKNGLNGAVIPMLLEVGDKVAIHPSGIQKVVIDSVEFEVVHEGDTIGYWRP